MTEAAAPNRIVFLDIDGILIHPGCYRQSDGSKRSGLQASPDPKCIAALNRITRERDALIVVSSIWRYEGLMFMRDKRLEWGIEALILDVTPDLRRLVPGYDRCVSPPRAEEIGRWIEEYEDRHPLERFVVLDDEPMTGEIGRHALKVDASTGLTEADAERAIALLTEASL